MLSRSIGTTKHNYLKTWNSHSSQNTRTRIYEAESKQDYFYLAAENQQIETNIISFMFSEQNKVLELILDILYTKTFLPTFHFFNGRKAVAERKISEGWDGPSFFFWQRKRAQQTENKPASLLISNLVSREHCSTLWSVLKPAVYKRTQKFSALWIEQFSTDENQLS